MIRNILNAIWTLHKNNRLKLTSQQKFVNEKDKLFTEEVKKIALTGKDNKRIQSIDSTEIYSYGTSKEVVCKRNKLNVTI